MKTAIIIGSGISGILPAMLLRKKGWSVTVIERDGMTGGGIRTFQHGGHPYTFGPRHFLSTDQSAYEFLNKYVPLRHLKKINYTYHEGDGAFYTYPIHQDDIDKNPKADKIKQELVCLPKESEAANFEEFWLSRVGETLYTSYIKEYNKKAWMIDDNTEMDWGFEATVKRLPLETGEPYEFKGWYNCYPIAADGYNQLFDIALEGCNVMLNTTVTGYDLENRAVYIGDQKLEADILISTISPDALMDNQYGELRYVGREFHKIVLPVESIFPNEVFWSYYPNPGEAQTRVVEYKKLTLHESPTTLLGVEIPSLKNKLYPTMIRAEVEKAQKYLDALPENVFSMGRMGRYRYIDIDDIILDSLAFAKEI